MKYKSCCDRRCLLGNCKTRDNGGCSCVCSLTDQINSMKRVIEGDLLDYGCLYIPDQKKRNEYFERKSEQEKEKHNYYRMIQAPEILKRLENSLKEYEIEE